MVDLAVHLRTLAERLPPGTPVTFTAVREELLALLDRELAAADLTLDEVGRRFGRTPSTIRSWCLAGRFPGAYKLRKLDWRIPPTAVRAFEEAERNRAAVPRTPDTYPRASQPSAEGALDDWRKVG